MKRIDTYEAQDYKKDSEGQIVTDILYKEPKDGSISLRKNMDHSSAEKKN